MTDETDYNLPRIEKVKKLRQKGINPYPNDVTPSSLAKDLLRHFGDWDGIRLETLKEEFSLAGRIIAGRSFGKAGFLKIRDNSGEIQIFCQKDNLAPEEFLLYKDFDIGDFVCVHGTLFRTKTNEFTLKARRIRLAAKSLRTLPEKWHGLTDVETRYRQRYVDLIANPAVRDTFIKRSLIIHEIRQFLLERDFLEVETPMMHPIPGGASARPFVTHHNQLDTDLYLRIAPELYLKRLVVGGLERVFEINRNFRNEGISIQHNPEFTMLEFYQSYATYIDLMRLTEDMLCRLAKKITGSTKVAYQGEMLDFTPPFAKMTMAKALVETGKISSLEVNDKKAMEEHCRRAGILERGAGGGLGLYQALLFEHKVEKELKQPTFITDFPVEVSPLSRRSDSQYDVSERFELFVYGREIANAFSELNDPVDQKERFAGQAEARKAGDEEAMFFDADFIRALEYGMPPTAGEGVGIDRLVMLLTNSASIRDVILFPQMRPEK